MARKSPGHMQSTLLVFCFVLELTLNGDTVLQGGRASQKLYVFTVRRPTYMTLSDQLVVR